MTDTVTRLMGLADVYADRFHEDRKRHTPETVHDRSAARIALEDELRAALAGPVVKFSLTSEPAMEPLAYINTNGVVHAAGYPWEAGEVLTPLFASSPPPPAQPMVQHLPADDTEGGAL